MPASHTQARTTFHLLLLALLLISGCSPQPKPIPFTAITLTPSIRAATAARMPASATPVPTETQAPTRTPRPTHTPTQAPPTATATPATVEERAALVENQLIPFLEVAGSPEQSFTLLDRMAYYQVPGVSIAVIHEGQVEWARAYGVTRVRGGSPLNPDTYFQAASMSKPATALLTLLLAQEGLFSLDDPVNGHLTSWQLPDSGGFSAQEVTIRRVLSHTAGLGVSGFSGYRPGSDLPSLPQILDGLAPANSQPVRIQYQPGIHYLYSGGGYVLLQLLLEDVTGQKFSDLMQERLLEPLGMEHSLFAQPLLNSLQGQAAYGHRFASNPIPDSWRIYPELAPAGLWSTPSDLAQILIEIGQAQDGQGRLLTQEMAELMTTPVKGDSGMGLVIPLQSDSTPGPLFGHGGSNQGYRGLMYAERGGKHGAVVMINSESGNELTFEIFRAIARVYNWSEVEHWKPGERAEGRFVEIDPQSLPALAGEYQIGRLTFTIEARDEHLWIQIPAGGPAYALFPDSPTEFFSEDASGWIFEKNPEGMVTAVQMRGWGGLENLKAMKIP